MFTKTQQKRNYSDHSAPAKGLAHLLLTLSLLFGAITTVSAQSAATEDSRLAQRLFLPLVANNSAAVMTDEASAPDVDNPIADAVILEAPLPDEIAAAAMNAVFIVTKGADTNDGVCDSDCSLREALAAAAANPATHDKVLLPAGLYQLPLGSLALINASVVGAGATTTVIEGNAAIGADAIRLPDVAAIGTWNEVVKVTIQSAGGYGIYQSEGRLTVKNARIRGNHFMGIYSLVGATGAAEETKIYNSIIEANGASGVTIGSLKGYVENSVLRNNGDDGLGIDASTVTVVRSTSSGNQAAGIAVMNGSQAEISQSASIFNQRGLSVNGGSQARMINSTISNNKNALEGAGVRVGGGSIVTLDFVTIARNTADADNNGDGDGGGIYIETNTTNRVTMRNSILADNLDKGGQAPDCLGVIHSDGYNLIETTANCTLIGSLVGNLTGVDPKLGALSNNGGTTKNHLPALLSPVIDTIPAPYCPLEFVDQRQLFRPSDGNDDGRTYCDMGAIERQ